MWKKKRIQIGRKIIKGIFAYYICETVLLISMIFNTIYIKNNFAGTTGERCETDTTDGCSTSPCKNGGMCINELNGFRCLCTTGFSGTTWVKFEFFWKFRYHSQEIVGDFYMIINTVYFIVYIFLALFMFVYAVWQIDMNLISNQIII